MPDKLVTLRNLINMLPESEPPDPTSIPPIAQPTKPPPSPHDPFPNPTIFRLMNWALDGSNLKSEHEIDRLVKDVLLADDFDISHLDGFRFGKEAARLDSYSHGYSSPEADDSETNIESTPTTPASGSISSAWLETTVKIKVPPEDTNFSIAEEDAPEFEVHGVFYRPLLSIINDAFKSRASDEFHFTPYHEFWMGGHDSQIERLIGELYTADGWLEVHKKIQQALDDSGSNEVVIIPMMFWSDSTHLATFGNASLWPIYLYFGGQSKYDRGKPSSHASHHVAYIPSVCHRTTLVIT